jgi:hypothetical protein
MDNHRKVIISKILKDAILTSEEMWENKEPHAQIIGYLQGAIKVIIQHLDEN